MREGQAPSFFDLYGRTPAVTADAPGRVNLIGEHTDYNGGLVMPIAIPRRTQVELAARSDERVRAFSAEIHDGQPVLEFTLGRETSRRSWVDYVQGITRVLRSHGARFGGFDLRVTSDVPVGSGLSSSAALEIALLRGLTVLFGLALPPATMAALGQRAEHEFVGAPVGIMDQMAAALADEHAALFLDTRDLRVERVPLPATCELAVIDSGIRHDHANGDYRVRRAECEQAARRLGVVQLRDLPDTGEPWRGLPAPLDRRVRHVVTENVRVRAARDAMLRGDAAALGRLFNASHASMRDDYDVSLPAIDQLVDAAQQNDEVLGARLTGGGFGGCIIVLTERQAATRTANRIVDAFRHQKGGRPTVVIDQLPSA